MEQVIIQKLVNNGSTSEIKLVVLSLSFFQVVYRFKNNKLQAVLFNDITNANPRLNSIYLAQIVKKQLALGCYLVKLNNTQQAILKMTKQNSNLAEGQKIMVQVVKEPTLPNKKAVVSHNIFLNYPLLKYKPFSNQLIFSKNISPHDKDKIITTLNLENEGVVIRSIYKHNLLQELHTSFLQAKAVFQKFNMQTKIGILHQPNFINNLIFNNAKLIPAEIILDKIENVTTSKEFLQQHHYLPTQIIIAKKATKYSNEVLLSYLNQIVEPYLAVNNDVSLSFFATEAFNYIDVNYNGNINVSKNKEEALYYANLVALEDIANAITLKNLSGQIMVDVLKIINKQYRHNLIKKLQHYFQADDSKTTVLGFSNLGLMEIARQKLTDSVNIYSSYAYSYQIFKLFIAIEVIVSNQPKAIISIICNQVFQEQILRLAGKEIFQINARLKEPLEFIIIEASNHKPIIKVR